MPPHASSAELDDLLAHAGWVRRVAARLVRDAAEAEDLAQEVWLRALESRPATIERPRAWLASVARTVALTRARGASRRRLREAAAPRGAEAPAADRVLAEAEREREVAALVLALDEPYRSVVLLRFYRDLPPRRIASELARPVATVKVQLQRGLELLRRQLDRRYGRREAWCTALLPLCARRASTVVLGAAGVALLAGTATLVLAWPDASRAELAPSAQALAGPSSDEVRTAKLDAPQPERRTRESAERLEPALVEPDAVAQGERPFESLQGRLVTLTGEPLAGVTVAARDPRRLSWARAPQSALVAEGFWLPLPPKRRSELASSPAAREAFLAEEFPREGHAAREARTLLEGGELALATARTDSRGCFSLQVKPGWRQIELVEAEHDVVGRGVPREAVDSESVWYFTAPARVLNGQVLDAHGGPRAGARVTLSNACPDEVSEQLAVGHGLLSPERETRSDAHGRFVFARAPCVPRAFLGVEQEDQSTSRTLDLSTGSAPESVTLRLGLLPEAERAHLVGTVLRPDGAPASEAELFLAGSQAWTDEAGAFELVLACAAEGADLVVFEPGFDPLVLPGFGTDLVGPGRQAVGVLRLPGTRLSLSGWVRDSDGAPWPEALLELEDGTHVEGLKGTLERNAAGSTLGALTEADGHFELRGLLPREYRLRVAGERFGPFLAGDRNLRLSTTTRRP